MTPKPIHDMYAAEPLPDPCTFCGGVVTVGEADPLCLASDTVAHAVCFLNDYSAWAAEVETRRVTLAQGSDE